MENVNIPVKCGGFTVPGLCKGGSGIQCCIEKKPCSSGKLTGSCIPTNQCTTGNIVSKICNGGDSIKCCLPKPDPIGTPCTYDKLDGNSSIKCCFEKKSCSKGSLKGSCIPNDQCTSGYEIDSIVSCPGGGNKINCCLPKKTRPSDPTTNNIIENLRKNLKFDSYKNEAMIAAATDMINAKYDPKFIAGVLGNIKNDGTPGEFESSHY
eukprot:jgi/Orpsp1_1/1182955/evm.model.c7180000083276.1